MAADDAAPASGSGTQPDVKPPPPPPRLGTLEGLSDGGLTALHPKRRLPLVFATSIEDDTTFNTVRAPLAPIACWRLNDIRFGFDSSFVHPDAQPELGELADLVEEQKDAPLSVFGHADPTGTDEYNKHLSGRRAMAVYAVVTRRDDIWESIYSSPLGRDDWKQHKWVALMLTTLGFDPDSTDDVKRFQSGHGLSPDGDIGHDTRKAIFLDFMDFLCDRGQGNPPFKLEAARFLGQGANPDGKGDYQGCSDFNPVVVFSSDEHQDLEKQENHGKRDDQNSPNRRIVIYLFPKGTTITTDKWPCPKVKDAATACQKRFWSDFKTRRANSDARRTFPKDRNTFACRFYHGLAMRSPCEVLQGNRKVRLKLLDPFGFVMPDEPCVLSVADASRNVVSDDDGFVQTTMPEGDVGILFADGRYGLLRSDPSTPYDFAKNAPPPGAAGDAVTSGPRSPDEGPWPDILGALDDLDTRYAGTQPDDCDLTED